MHHYDTFVYYIIVSTLLMSSFLIIILLYLHILTHFSGLTIPEEEELLRLLTPIVKLFTAKEAIAVSSEVIEAMGGQGFIEDTGVAKHLRNVQVSAIWEGTTNILALDVLRAMGGKDRFGLFVKVRYGSERGRGRRREERKEKWFWNHGSGMIIVVMG